jgi:hypothetical protein
MSCAGIKGLFTCCQVLVSSAAWSSKLTAQRFRYRAMAVLARDSPLKGPLQLGDWLQRLLYFAADAAAAGDRRLASRALDGFSAAAAVRSARGQASVTAPHHSLRAQFPRHKLAACQHHTENALAMLHDIGHTIIVPGKAAGFGFPRLWGFHLPQAGGTRISAPLRQCNALPLAAQLWRNADAQLQRSLMTAVSAVASAGGAH